MECNKMTKPKMKTIIEKKKIGKNTKYLWEKRKMGKKIKKKTGE